MTQQSTVACLFFIIFMINIFELGSSSSDCVWKVTFWNDHGGNSLINLDRHPIQCPSKMALNQMHLEKDDLGNIRYHYICCNYTVHTDNDETELCVEKSTPLTSFTSLTVMCDGVGQVLNGLKFVRETDTSFNYRDKPLRVSYTYKCCSTGRNITNQSIVCSNNELETNYKPFQLNQNSKADPRQLAGHIVQCPLINTIGLLRGFSPRTNEPNNQLHYVYQCCYVAKKPVCTLPSDRFVQVTRCDVTSSAIDLSCSYSKTIGVVNHESSNRGGASFNSSNHEISQANSESNTQSSSKNFGWYAGASVGAFGVSVQAGVSGGTNSEVSKALQQTFSTGIGQSQTTSVDWRTESSSSFNSQTTQDAHFVCPSGYTCTLYQAVGTCGNYEINSSTFKLVTLHNETTSSTGTTTTTSDNNADDEDENTNIEWSGAIASLACRFNKGRVIEKIVANEYNACVDYCQANPICTHLNYQLDDKKLVGSCEILSGSTTMADVTNTRNTQHVCAMLPNNFNSHINA